MSQTLKNAPGSHPSEPSQKHWEEEHWIDEATRLKCQARRNWRGMWFGYVQVPDENPLFGKRSSELIDSPLMPSELNMHTAFSGRLVNGDKSFDGDKWWLGSDCPSLHTWAVAIHINHGGIIDGDLGYIKYRCARLARQIVEIGKKDCDMAEFIDQKTGLKCIISCRDWWSYFVELPKEVVSAEGRINEISYEGPHPITGSDESVWVGAHYKTDNELDEEEEQIVKQLCAELAQKVAKMHGKEF